MAFLRRWCVALSLLLGAIAAYSAAVVWKYGSHLSSDVWPQVNVFLHIRVVYVAAPMAVAIGLLSAVLGIYLRSRNSNLSRAWKPALRTVLISALVSAACFWATWHVAHRPRLSGHDDPEAREATLAFNSILRDLEMAGFQTPPALAFHGMDGGESLPDGMTIVYRDPQLPAGRPATCVSRSPGGTEVPCRSVAEASLMEIVVADAASIDSRSPFAPGARLIAVAAPECSDVNRGMAILEVLKTTSSSLDTNRVLVEVVPIPGRELEGSLPPEFDGNLPPECTVVGGFHVVQYRILQLSNGAPLWLGRRDLADGPLWRHVAFTDDLQFHYRVGTSEVWVDARPEPPPGERPHIAPTEIRVTMDWTIQGVPVPENGWTLSIPVKLPNVIPPAVPGKKLPE